MKIICLFLFTLSLLANSIASDDEIIKNLEFFQDFELIKTSESFTYIENKNLNPKQDKDKIIDENIPQVESIK